MPKPLTEADKEGREQTGATKVIVEGGMHDAWRTHHFLAVDAEISDDATKLVFQGDYELTLVGKWTKDGMEKLVPVGEEVVSALNSGILFRIERPTTVITEDGRVFHDLSLQGEGNPNADRLDSVVASLHRDYPGINPVTTLYRAQREWLEQKAYHNTGYGRVTFPDTPMSPWAPGEMEHILETGRKLLPKP